MTSMRLDRATIDASHEFMATAQRLLTLFDLEAEAYELLAYLEDWHDLEPEDIAEGKAQLALIDQMLMEKTESYVSVIRSLEAMADAREAEEHRLRDRKQTARRHADWLKNRLLVHMQTTGRQRVETSRFSLSIRQNAPSCVVLEEMMVPAEFKKTVITTTVDKNAIKAHVKATGEVVPGIELVRSESLSIR